jgi:hypothetical protein
MTGGLIKRRCLSWMLWFTPVNLATQEAEIRKFEVQSQAGK